MHFKINFFLKSDIIKILDLPRSKQARIIKMMKEIKSLRPAALRNIAVLLSTAALTALNTTLLLASLLLLPQKPYSFVVLASIMHAIQVVIFLLLGTSLSIFESYAKLIIKILKDHEEYFNCIVKVNNLQSTFEI